LLPGIDIGGVLGGELNADRVETAQEGTDGTTDAPRRASALTPVRIKRVLDILYSIHRLVEYC